MSNYSSANIYTTNIQNSYLNDVGDTFIASPSIPNYFNDALDIRETDILFSGVFEEDEDAGTSINIPNHGLMTGERIIYVAV